MKKNKMTTVLEIIIIIQSAAFLALGAFLVSTVVNRPLAEPIVLAKASGPATLVPTAAAAPEKKQDAQVQKPAETCGNSGSLTVLFTGEDFSQGVWPLGADTVRVVKFDFSGKKISVVAFPRDLWVKTPGLAEQKFPETALGLSYYYEKQATNGSEKHKVTAATAMVAQALLDNFDVTAQDYFTIQLDSAKDMIDTIGGVDINVPESIFTEYGELIPAGPQTMSGHIASEYARSYAQGDATRILRQNLLVKALQTKLISANILPKIPDLYKQFDKSIVTDLSPRQLYDLACLANAVPQEQIAFYEIGGDLVTARSDGALIPDIAKIEAKLKEWLQ